MEKSSLQPLVSVRAEWAIPQQLEALADALSGVGPALAFGESTFTEVPHGCALVLPTSGSSGVPKSVALSSAAVIASAKASHAFLGAQPGDRWSLLLPTTHIAGVNVLVRSLELGTELRGIDDGADFTAIVPTQLHRALNGDAQLLEHLQHAKAVLVGGAATSPELQEEAAQNDIHLVTTYGMTEMSGGCIYNGRPLDGVEVRISDGAIELNGPMKAIGYLGEAPFGDSFFRTSDAGRLEDGILEVIGRIDDQIITGGEKLSLGAITDFLNTGSGQRFIAIGLPDAEWGQALAIASDGPIDESALKSALRQRFGAHASPKRFAANIELPLTALGKPDRRTLVEIFGRLP